MPNLKNESPNPIIWIILIITTVILAGVAGCSRKPATPGASTPTSPSTTIAPDTNTIDDASVILHEKFDNLEQGKWPKDWHGWESGAKSNMKIKDEAGKHYLEFAASNAFRMRLSRIIPLSPDFSAYEFSCRARCVDMVPGGGQIRGATMGVDWIDANKKDISQYDLDYITEPGDWIKLSGVYKAPTNATAMRVFPLLNRCGATVDFEDITVRGVEMEPEKEVYMEYFDKADKPDKLTNWSWDVATPGEDLFIKAEGNTHYLEYQGTNDTEVEHLGGVDVPLDPSWHRVRITVTARGQKLFTDSTQSVAGFLMLCYWKADNGQMASHYRVQMDNVRNNDVWKRVEAVRDIPEGAKFLSINFLSMYASGAVDVGSVKVTVVP